MNIDSETYIAHLNDMKSILIESMDTDENVQIQKDLAEPIVSLIQGQIQSLDRKTMQLSELNPHKLYRMTEEFIERDNREEVKEKFRSYLAVIQSIIKNE